MIPIVLSLQSKLDYTNSKVLDEIRKLNHAFSKLKSVLLMTKKGTSLLTSRLVIMERQC